VVRDSVRRLVLRFYRQICPINVCQNASHIASDLVRFGDILNPQTIRDITAATKKVTESPTEKIPQFVALMKVIERNRKISVSTKSVATDLLFIFLRLFFIFFA
jgi:hypothetical protein